MEGDKQLTEERNLGSNLLSIAACLVAYLGVGQSLTLCYAHAQGDPDLDRSL